MRGPVLLHVVILAACGRDAPPPSADLYHSVEAVVAEPARFRERVVKVRGFVVAGSIRIKRTETGSERQFELQDGGQRLVVRFAGPPPDLLDDRAEVVAVGRLTGEGGALRLEADELIAKCPERYGAGGDRDLM